METFADPAGNMYRSSDRWPAVVASIVAVGVWYARYQVWGEPAVEAGYSPGEHAPRSSNHPCCLGA